MNTVVRVGDTVRRAMGPHSPQVHALLQHLRLHGFEEAPELLGVDSKGREVLRYIPGEEALQADPAFLWSDTTLAASGHLLRRFHDAQAGLEARAGAAFSPIGREPDGPSEVICHNDFAPYNSICDQGALVGIIDFDLVAPGSRGWDLAWTAINWVPLFDPADHPRRRLDLPETARRLRLLCDAYGFLDRPELVATARRRMAHHAAIWAQRWVRRDPWAILTEPYQPLWNRVRQFVETNSEALSS